MAINIVFLELPSGKRPVEEYLLSIDVEAAARITKQLEDLVQAVNPMVYIQHCGWIEKMNGYKKYSLYEMKFRRFKDIRHRILSCLNGGTLYLVHAFGKKTGKIQKREIDTSIHRIKNNI